MVSSPGSRCGRRPLRSGASRGLHGERGERSGEDDDDSAIRHAGHSSSRGALRSVGDDPQVDSGQQLHQPRRQRMGRQPPQRPARLRRPHQDVGSAPIASDPLGDPRDVLAVLDQQVRSEHAGQPPQRLELVLLLLARLVLGDPEQVELGAEPLRRPPRAPDDRCDLGCGSTSASSRSPIACGAAASIRRSSRPRGLGSEGIRLASTSSATWRSATSRSADRFSILKKLVSAAWTRSWRIDLAVASAAGSATPA